MAARTHATKQAILNAIADLGGEARQIGIAKALGRESGTAYVRLRKTIKQMVKSHVLKIVRRGVYCQHPTFHRRGFDQRHSIVRQIELYLVERCGVAETVAIHDAVAARDLTGGYRDTDHHQVTYALAQTPEKFCQPYGVGIWALLDAARAKLPLLGKWVDKEMTPTERDGFFQQVGEAFSEARAEMLIGDFVCQPDIWDALMVMADRAHEAKTKARGQIRCEVVSEFSATGVEASEYAITIATYEREDTDLPKFLYRQFEDGDAGLHLVAPPAFYRGAAALFGVDAAQLSRGKVLRLPRKRKEISELASLLSSS